MHRQKVFAPLSRVLRRSQPGAQAPSGVIGGDANLRLRIPASASSSLRWLLDDRVAVRWIREDAGRRAGWRLCELVHPPEVIGANAIVDRSAVRREPWVDAIRAAVRRAVGGADERVAEHLGLPTGIRDRGPVLLVCAVPEGDVEDPDRLEA